MRLPSLRYDRLMWVFFLFIVLMIWLIARNKKASEFVENVEVVVEPLESGDKLISERDVKQVLLEAFGNTLEGTEMANIEVERMERVLEIDPFVQDAETYIDQNSKLHVEISQRQPIVRILDNKGGNYYLDGMGKKMPPSKNFAARVLVATGNVAPYTPEFRQKRRNTLKDLFFIVESLMKDEFLRDFIQQIHIAENGDFWLVPLIGDQKIILGSARRLEDKLYRLKVFYQKGMPYTGWRKYETINLKYNGQIVCKR